MGFDVVNLRNNTIANEMNSAKNLLPKTQNAELLNFPNLYSCVINCSCTTPHKTYDIWSPTKQKSSLTFLLNSGIGPFDRLILSGLSSRFVGSSGALLLTRSLSELFARILCSVFMAVCSLCNNFYFDRYGLMWLSLMNWSRPHLNTTSRLPLII